MNTLNGKVPANCEGENRHWLALKLIPRLAIKKKLALVEKYGINALFDSCVDLSSVALSSHQKAAIESPDWPRIDKLLADSNQNNIQVINFANKHYPTLLKEIYDPPLVLFTKGNIDLLNQQQVAVVGSRNSSNSGREHAFAFSQQLAKNSIVITSGLALGIDAAAHRGAITTKNATIAVVATGLEQVYPARHKKLANEILASGGLIISEYPVGTFPKPGLFPKRNRLISGMSLGVLVVEATLKSGSLITAKSALDQNREVFAIPNSIENPQGKGCHWLIKQGAKLVEDYADIIEDLDIKPINELISCGSSPTESNSKKSNHGGLSNDLLLASVGYEITPVDVVVSRSKLPTDVVLTQLTMLELKGLVYAVPGGYLRKS